MKTPGSPKPLKGKCGAKLIKSKKKYGKIRYCTAFPVRGRTRCRSHGGTTPQGIASPHYRGKGYSEAVPKHLKDIYEAYFNDHDLLSLHKEIALCDTRIEDLLTQISGRMGDEVGEDDRSTWTEIREEQKNKAKLVGVAQRVEFAEGRAVSMEALMAIQSESERMAPPEKDGPFAPPYK